LLLQTFHEGFLPIRGEPVLLVSHSIEHNPKWLDVTNNMDMLIWKSPKPDRITMEKYRSPKEVCDIIPGMTEALLAQMRFRGDGPPFIAASPKKRVYSEASLHAWLASRERTSTAEKVSA